MDALVIKLIIMTCAALLMTLTLIFFEWRIKQLHKLNTGIKAALAVVLVGVLISLLTVR